MSAETREQAQPQLEWPCPGCDEVWLTDDDGSIESSLAGCECPDCGTTLPEQPTRPRCSAPCAHGRGCPRLSVENVRPRLCGNHHRQRKRELAQERLEALAEDYWEERETRGYL